MNTISVITPTYNSEASLSRCIKSIRSQRNVNIEHLVIDGMSEDKTLEILRKFHIASVFSEPDLGIYDAINKGLRLAKGDFIAICHSDDRYIDDDALYRLTESIQSQNVDFAYADCVYERNSQFVRYYRSGALNAKRLSYGLAPAHTTLVMRRSLLSLVGEYSLRYPICGDFDYFTRLCGKSYSYIREPLVAMSVGGTSKFNCKTAWHLNLDLCEILTKRGISSNLLKIVSRYPYKKVSSQLNMAIYRWKNVSNFGN